MKVCEKVSEVAGHLKGYKNNDRLWFDYCRDVEPSRRLSVNVTYLRTPNNDKYTRIVFRWKEE